MLDLNSVREEVKHPGALRNINKQTAWKWASRAAAAYELAVTEYDDKFVRHMILASEFFGEALEHAAQVDHSLVQEVNDAVNPYMQKAWAFNDLKMGEKNV